jgi:hypothetical protein
LLPLLICASCGILKKKVEGRVKSIIFIPIKVDFTLKAHGCF